MTTIIVIESTGVQYCEGFQKDQDAKIQKHSKIFWMTRSLLAETNNCEKVILILVIHSTECSINVTCQKMRKYRLIANLGNYTVWLR